MTDPSLPKVEAASPRVPAGLSPQRILTTTWLAVFATSLLFRAVDPIIPKIASDLVAPTETVALLATAFALPYALMQPVLGAAADVVGKTRMMFACVVVVTIATFAGAFAPNLGVLMVTRVITGIVAGGVFPISLAIAGDVVPVGNRQVAIGRLLAGAMLGNVLGSTLSGIVADMAGWRGVFYVDGTFALIALVACFIGFGGPGSKPPETVDLRSVPQNYKAIFLHPLAKYCFGAVLMEGMFLFGLFPFIAQLLHDTGETRASIAGTVIAGFGVGGLIYSLVIGWLLRRFGDRRLMVAGGVLMGLGLMSMAFHLHWQAQVAVFVMFGLAFYLLHGVIQIFVTELAPKARSSATAMHSSFFFAGQSLGPIYYRFGLAGPGLTLTVLLAALVLIATGIVCALRLRHRPR